MIDVFKTKLCKQLRTSIKFFPSYQWLHCTTCANEVSEGQAISLTSSGSWLKNLPWFLENHPWFLDNPLQNWGFRRLQKSTLIFRPSCFHWRCSDTAYKQASYISTSEPFPAPFDATACWTSLFISAWCSSSVRRSTTASLKLVSKKRPLVAM